MLLRPVLIASVLSLGLAACAGTPTPPPTDATSPSPLTAQGAWKLNAATAANGSVLLPAGTDYRLQFVDDRISVLGGCNRMSGSYAMVDGKLQVGPLASTRMACPEPRMQHDNTMTKLLEQPLTMFLMESYPEQLRLETPAGDKLSFTAMPLE